MSASMWMWDQGINASPSLSLYLCVCVCVCSVAAVALSRAICVLGRYGDWEGKRGERERPPLPRFEASADRVLGTTR